ncbi:MAG: copper chaperone PCu(A)C [Proteobacteria bacterium]|nr:copper chaperone PCu(A)C [Pseudomonadota bacterium]
MTRQIRFLALLFSFIAINAAIAREFRIGSIEILRPWSPATPKGAAVAGGYMQIVNRGAVADRLVGGTLTAAGRFMVHEMSMVDGIMRMRPLAQGIEIAPGATVDLKPGSLHVMFSDLKTQLQPGDHIKGTLVFEKAGSIEIEYVVEAVGGGSSRHTPTHGG